jgi:hypothetical protein
MTEGDYILATANKVFINFSLSPIHLETKLEADILKKVHLHSVATAFASIVFPFPGGPYKSIPVSGDLIP